MTLGSDLRGRQVGDFLIAQEIGHGGMGAAYLAEQLALRREVVIKVIAADTVGEEHKIRFLREARLASRLDHPYAAHVYAFGAETDGLLWIAMELVRGVPLDRMLADQGPMPLARFVPLFDRLCEVVHSAHEQGIIHRDIKPANVMVVRRSGRLLPKLLDLGIARAVASVELGPAAASPSLTGTLELSVADAPLVDQGRSVTVSGKLVGSPAYMAPEQWVDATRADARTDLYALGVTAFELLTGRLPFSGPTVLATARAHARQEVPALGRGLPDALDRVLARALAKRAAERQPDVLALAAAIREAARDATTTGAGAGVLDEVVRDAFVAAGPQPVAEALLELAAARAPAAAWDAVWRVVAVSVRVLGAIAIAARARTGAPAAADDAGKQIRALVERGLDLEQWIALVAALVAPFATRAQAHPVPELVALHFTDGAPRHVFADLIAIRGGATADAVEPELVHRALAELGVVLRACTFLTDYTWVVAGAAGGESWTGPRRQPRDRGALPADAAPGSVWLVDPDGTAVLELSPIVTVAPPAPGADDEAFLLDGPARRGARAVAWPREFERHDDSLREFIDAHVAPLGDRAAAAEQDDRAPYRGLATFGPGDAAMFFGREREVEAVVNRLRIQPLIAVVGPSGVGKSSFVQAGVIPALPESWQALTLRPGASPLTALEARLAAAGASATGLADRLRTDPGALREVVDDAARRLGARLVLVIDQLEEMFTQCRDAAIREAFGRALASVAATAESPVRIVLTLRDDFLVRGAELAGLGDRLQTSLELLTLPDADTLRRILVEPLAQVGYAFEDASLPDQMVGAVRDHPGALALLSFAAAKLWELRDRRFRHVPNKAYEAIGGVAGALARHAEDTLGALPEADRGLVRELFRHLVTSEGTRAALRRDEALELLGKTTAAERVIEALVERRLLVGYEADGGADWIEVIHEALLTAWPRLVTWQREDAEGARLRDQLRAAARQWGERGRAKGLLWRGEALVEYRLWRSRHGGALTDLERAFADASGADEARGRNIRRGVVTVVIALTAVFVVMLWRANRAEQASRREAVANADRAVGLLRDSYVEQGRLLALQGDKRGALVNLAKAYEMGDTAPPIRLLLEESSRSMRARRLALAGHTDKLWEAVYSPDGSRIATASTDGTTRIWDAASGAQLDVIDLKSAAVAVAFSPDGRYLATGGWGQQVIVWDVGARRQASALDVPERVITVLFDRTGERLVTVSATGVIRIWRLADRTSVEVPSTGGAVVVAMCARADCFVTANELGEVVAWDLAAADLRPTPRHTHRAPITAIAVQPDGRTIAVGSKTGELVLIRPDGTLVEHRDAHGELIFDIAFSPDGTLVATGGDDDVARLWDVATGAPRAVLAGHRGNVTSARFSPQGDVVVTTSVDTMIRLWSTTGTLIGDLSGHESLVFAPSFRADGTRLVTPSWDHRALVWDLVAARQVQPLLAAKVTTSVVVDPEQARVIAHWTAFAPAGDRVAFVAEADAALVIAQTGVPGECRASASAPVRSLAWSPDGTRVATTRDNARTVQIWNVRCELERTVDAGTDAVAIGFTADGGLITGGADRALRIRDLATGSERATFSDLPAAIIDVGAHPDGTQVWAATAGGEGRIATVVLQDLAAAARRVVLEAGPLGITAVTFDRARHRVLAASLDQQLRIWDAAGNLIDTLDASGPLWDVALGPDGATIIGAGGIAPVVWDAETRARLGGLEGHSDLVIAAGFLDPTLAITAARDGTVRVWDLSTRRPILVFDGSRVAISADRSAVLLTGQGGTRLWRPRFPIPDDVHHLP